MAHSAAVWTADRVRALPDDGKRYEVVDGDLLVTPSPRRRHQHAVAVLYRLLDDHARGHGFGGAWFSPSDVELDPRSLVQPDLFVEALVGGRPSMEWNSGAPILLVVEVLSPSTARADRTIKRRRYQRAGIPEYWIVDVDARAIERWRPGEERPEVLSETMVWRPAPDVAPLEVDLPALFARIAGEVM